MRTIGRATRRVAAALVLVAATAGAQATAPFVRVAVVAPVPGDPVASGNALLAAYASITGASDTNQWLVQVEPGTFELGAQVLVMKPWVSVAGSGREATILRGAGTDGSIYSGVVQGAENSEIRDLTVQGGGTPDYGQGITVYSQTGTFTIRDVNVRMSGSGDCAGLRTMHATVVVRNSSVTSTCTGANNYGMVLRDLTLASLEDLQIVVKNGDKNWGVWCADAGLPWMTRDVSITVSGGTQGVAMFIEPTYLSNANVQIHHSDFTTYGSQINMGLALDTPFFLAGGEAAVAKRTRASETEEPQGAPIAVTVRAFHSRVQAFPSVAANGAGFVGDGDTTRLFVDSTSVSVSGPTLRDWGVANVGGSKLGGTAMAGVSAGSCAGNWDESYAFHASDCF